MLTPRIKFTTVQIKQVVLWGAPRTGQLAASPLTGIERAALAGLLKALVEERYGVHRGERTGKEQGQGDRSCDWGCKWFTPHLRNKNLFLQGLIIGRTGAYSLARI